MAQESEQHVEHDDRPRVADVGEIVDRGPADIQRTASGSIGREILLAAGEGVVETQLRRPPPPRASRLWGRGGEFIGKSRRLHLVRAERQTGVVRVWPDDRFSMALKKIMRREPASLELAANNANPGDAERARHDAHACVHPCVFVKAESPEERYKTLYRDVIRRRARHGVKTTYVIRMKIKRGTKRRPKPLKTLGRGTKMELRPTADSHDARRGGL